MIDFETRNAIDYAKEHAQTGLKQFPFDSVYQTTMIQIGWIESDIASLGCLSLKTKTDFCLGIMAAKELGNDEHDFAHALHVINFWVDEQTS